MNEGGRIAASYVTGTVDGSFYNVGGLVGWNYGGVIEGSYSMASVSMRGEAGNGGGLTGRNTDDDNRVDRGTVRNAYSTGRVSGGGARVSGLVGLNSGTVSNSYYDAETSGRSGGTGAKTTAELQSPTSASGIYAQWNQLLWDFGTETDYPLLVVDFDSDGVASWQEFGQQTRTTPPSATVRSVRLSGQPGVDETYAIDDVIEVVVTFSEEVTVTGAPQLALDFDGTARTASYDSAAGIGVFFTYTVTEGDLAKNGVAIPANALTLNGGAIAGPSGAAANLAHDAIAAVSFHRVDGVRPTISSGSASEDGTQVSVVLTEPVQNSPLLHWFIDEHKLRQRSSS